MTEGHFLNCMDDNCELFACVYRRDAERKIERLENADYKKAVNNQFAKQFDAVSSELGQAQKKVKGMKGALKIYERAELLAAYDGLFREAVYFSSVGITIAKVFEVRRNSLIEWCKKVGEAKDKFDAEIIQWLREP